ncbi:hypothetical protein C0989_004821 [Termitomyces sp. Mn162]|nr:hypothetical protein C0989_004821 [Termitomyces sp. Mn162]
MASVSPVLGLPSVQGSAILQLGSGQPFVMVWRESDPSNQILVAATPLAFVNYFVDDMMISSPVFHHDGPQASVLPVWEQGWVVGDMALEQAGMESGEGALLVIREM